MRCRAVTACAAEIAAGRMSLRLRAVEDFEFAPGEDAYDLAIAIRVGALKGRHPELEASALAALTLERRLLIKRGGVLEEVRPQR